MHQPSPVRLAAIAVLALAAPAAAQNYGTQPGYQPPAYQPPAFQPPAFQPGPYQPSPAQPGYPAPPSQPTGGPGIIGTWSGTSSGTSGQIQIAEAYNPDGTFVSVGRLANGFIARVWGTYSLSPAGPDQFRLETRLAGWLPREICQQLAGNPPQCQPMQIAATGVSLVSFTSPDQIQSASQTEAGSYSVEQRDSQPVLLQVQAPQRWVNIIQPSPQEPASAPVAGGYVPTYRPTPSRPYMNGCPGDDGARIRCRYSGRLVPSGGCLQCVD